VSASEAHALADVQSRVTKELGPFLPITELCGWPR